MPLPTSNGASTGILPLVANSFVLQWNNENVMSFVEVSGMESETEVQELVQVAKGGKRIISKSYGTFPQKPGRITARYIAQKNDPIRKWREQVVTGNLAEAVRNCSVVAYESEDTEAFRIDLLNAWPSKYTWSTMNATANEALTITVVIEYERLSFGDAA